jgi:hypothetical protein
LAVVIDRTRRVLPEVEDQEGNVVLLRAGGVVAGKTSDIQRRDSLQNQPSINRTNNRVGVPGVVTAAIAALSGIF